MSIESKVVMAKSKEELEIQINSTITGRQVKNISHSHTRDGSGIMYTATILMDKQNSGSRQHLVEG